MSDTYILLVLAVGVSVLLIVCMVVSLIVILRLRRAVTSQFKILDNVLSSIQEERGRDTPQEPRNE